MNFTVRFIGSLIYLCIVLIALSAALFWFDTGSWLVLPLAQRAGNFFLAPMTLTIDSVNGSVRQGYTLEGLRLTSGDKDLFTLDYASVSPDWTLALAGMNGLPFIKSLNVHGVSTDLDNVMTIANHFAASGDEEPEDENDEPLSIHINPFTLSVSDVNFGSPYANLALDAITLNPDGNFALNAEILSRDNTLPLKAKAHINFEPLEVESSNLQIGNNGTGKLVGKLEPLDVRLFLTALSLEEFLKFAPDLGVKASGRIDGKFFAANDEGTLKASGVVSMPRANIMDVPLNFRLPFSWDGVSVFAVNDAVLNTNLATAKLNAETDINTLSVKAKGEALNISLNEIGKMFAPEVGVIGEGGSVKFDVDTVLSGDILSRTRADFTASIPQITAAGLRIIRGVSAKLKLTPGDIPRISANGEVFGGKLFARGEAQTDGIGGIKPSAIVSIVNLDIPTVIRTFPAAAKAVSKPSGKLTARAVISDKLDVDGRITSDRLSVNGVTLSNILAELAYSHSKGTADIENLSLNLGRGSITGSGSANLNTERFSFRADARNVEPRVIPELRDVKGAYSLTAQGSGKYTDINSINVEADITAKNIGYSDFTIGSANVPVDFVKGVATVSNGVITLPKGKVYLNGKADINTSMFDFTADAQNVEPRYIKALKDLAGTYNLKASASGNYMDVKTINANADLKARNVGYSGMRIGNIDLPVTFSNNLLNISNARASLPGGRLDLNGSVNIKDTENPMLDVATSTTGINLAEVMKTFSLQNPDMPISGRVWGNALIRGPLKKATVSARLGAAEIKAGDLVRMSKGSIEVQGNTQEIVVRKLEARINSSDIQGSGRVHINQQDIMKSKVDVKTNFRWINLKRILTQVMGSAPVTGMLRGDIALKGTIDDPSLDVALKSPVIYGTTEIHDITTRLRTPEPNHYVVNTSARIDGFKPAADIDITNNGGIWAYSVKTSPLNIDEAVKTQLPDMAGMARGFLTVKVDGNTAPSSDIHINANIPSLDVIDKVNVKNISLPVVFSQSANKVELRNGSAEISDGQVNTGFEYRLSDASWNGNVKVLHLNFGELVSKFLPAGELIGSVDAQVTMKGRAPTDANAKMQTSFAKGKFSTSPGYFHKLDLLDNITPTKRVSFEKIEGTFFWNGSDLFLNPGTRATAGKDEPLYRYVNLNGSLGVLGKGLHLVVDGRFDLKILDQFLGAMKGVFQYMTGSLFRDVLKDAAGRVLGIKRKDFQNVSFTLANSWNDLELLDIKITKAIEDFLPIDILNRDAEEQKNDVQFKLKLKIPTGPGGKSVEEESTSDQFKQQLIDNLFNWGL